MEMKRSLELLAYAAVCFKHCTNPFENMHLVKKKVTADECIDLSNMIADILEDDIDLVACTEALRAGKGLLGKEWIAQAEKDFAETQK